MPCLNAAVTIINKSCLLLSLKKQPQSFIKEISLGKAGFRFRLSVCQSFMPHRSWKHSEISLLDVQLYLRLIKLTWTNSNHSIKRCKLCFTDLIADFSESLHKRMLIKICTFAKKYAVSCGGFRLWVFNFLHRRSKKCLWKNWFVSSVKLII